MSCTSEYCRCCYSFEGLKNLSNRALDVYSLIYRPQGHKNDNTDIAACIQCREFLKQVHYFKLEAHRVDDMNIKPKAEFILKNTIDENLSVVFVKNEIKGEFNEIEQVEIDFDSKSKQTLSEICPEKQFVLNHNENNLLIELYDRESNIIRKKGQIAHFAEEPLGCDNCTFKCTTKHQMIAHQITHFKPPLIDESTEIHYNEEKPFTCNQCNYRFKYNSRLVAHKRIHLKDCDKPYKCSECSYAAASNSSLKSHIACKHGKEKPFSCDQCDYCCKLKAQLVVHKKIHSKDSEKSYKCAECSFITASYRNLKYHVKCRHNEERPFECDQCNYRTKLKAVLLAHKKTHLKIRDKPYICSECSFTTATKRTLSNHIACKHSNERPFSCDQCDYSCKLKTLLIAHKKTHLKDRDKPHKCSKCSYMAMTYRSLRSHVAFKHSDLKPFFCDQCSYRSQLQAQMIAHKKIHSL